MKEINIKEGNTIEHLKADLEEIKSEQEAFKNRNTELKDEIRSMRTQLSAYSGSIPAGSTPSPRSWACMAASGGTARTETNYQDRQRLGIRRKTPTMSESAHNLGSPTIMEENNLAMKWFHINEIVWMKTPDKLLSMNASLGIWLDTPDAAE
ncbi:uncharacterized protein Z519_01567 [Cladophialophora bantiana CBS 173.52]|uniref:Uncharacterized protein n=1 Tax=Cladophialophora bantiana (strain ATCC 10958 / CBS 173.52 / CDC B-1940 / NIH 8579) TaxID=1442370 RepID=A0A0D2HX70_CLAB1|nr:uncharacterized protein Z519_01567 [Cladophialophora bantiana CBS 173.52]KIW97983.1 hypothetical protein Z519_01567 [Cladophialophora bantiana CBS 173.52]